MLTLLLLLLLALQLCHMLPFPSMAQQVYTDNAMLDCYANNSASTLGYSCNGEEPTCSTYAIFRSTSTYGTPIMIAYFLNASVPDIAQRNNVTQIYPFPLNTLVLVPLTCSCNGAASDRYYQHDASYTLNSETETYMIVANDTYQGLTTCQAMMEQNPKHDSRELEKGFALRVPLRCACPTTAQIAAGYRYLLTYPVIPEDEISKIAENLGTDERAILTANSLSDKSTIYPYTTLLIPLKSPPTTESLLSRNTSSPPPEPPPNTTTTTGSRKSIVILTVFAAAAAALLAILLFVGVFLYRRRRRPAVALTKPEKGDERVNFATPGLSEEVRLLVGSLTVYEYDDLKRSTGFFGEEHRIDGSSVYRGEINGDLAAVKRMKGDITREISILRKLNHFNLVRLSGFCLHDDSTYLVFEFADKGSLHSWLHGPKSGSLGWRLRVQIALDVADGLNYLHNYANPPCIHKDLNSSNVLLDGEFRAKISNFGLARSSSAEEEGKGERPQVTSHVVGTQGYLSPEYVQLGLISPELDIFAFGVLMLELISGKEAVHDEALLSASIVPLLQGEDASEKLKLWVDRSIGESYSAVSAFAMAQLAKRCVAPDPRARPTISEVYVALSGINSADLDWDSSWETNNTGSTFPKNPSRGEL